MKAVLGGKVVMYAGLCARERNVYKKNEVVKGMDGGYDGQSAVKE